MLSDSVSKLQSVGKETVAKLKDIHAAALVSTNSEDANTLQDFTENINTVVTGRLLQLGRNSAGDSAWLPTYLQAALLAVWSCMLEEALHVLLKTHIPTADDAMQLGISASCLTGVSKISTEASVFSGC